MTMGYTLLHVTIHNFTTTINTNSYVQYGYRIVPICINWQVMVRFSFAQGSEPQTGQRSSCLSATGTY